MEYANAGAVVRSAGSTLSRAKGCYPSRCASRCPKELEDFSLEIHKTEIANRAAGQLIMRDSIYRHDNRIAISSGDTRSRQLSSSIRDTCPDSISCR